MAGLFHLKIPSGFIHGVAGVRVSLLLRLNNIPYYILFTYSSVYRHLGGSRHVAVVNTAAVKRDIQIPL